MHKINSQKKLFSVIIVSYNNYKYIYDAIDSVLKQKYSNIELIISNDGSKDFLEEEIKKYIDSNNFNQNIKKLVINNNETNIGTVKNLNKSIKLSNGELIFLMAADDSLYDDEVLEKFANYFDKLGENVHVITSQTAMCDETMNVIESLALSEELINIIKTYHPQDMFKHLAHTYTIPATSTCYRRSFYDIVGLYDEDYFLIEDAPQFIRMSRLGVRAYYLDIIAAKHRDGGISHGNKSNGEDSFAKYWKDEIKFYEKEVFLYPDIMGKKILNYVKEKHYLVTRSYVYRFEWKNYNTFEKIIFIAKNINYVSKKTIRPNIDKIVQFSFNFSKMKDFISIGAMLLIISTIISVSFDDSILLFKANKIFNFLGISISFSFLCLCIINVIYRIYRTIKMMKKIIFKE